MARRATESDEDASLPSPAQNRARDELIPNKSDRKRAVTVALRFGARERTPEPR